MRRKRWLRWILPLTACFLISGCGADVQSGGGMQSYKDTKDIVLDILKTDEAKKAIQEAAVGGSSGTGMQLLSAQQNVELQTAVKDVLTDPNYNKQLKEMMMHPKFAGEFAKVIAKENKQLHKDLMKDPEYQKQMLDLMKNPEFEKLVMEVMKTTPYRAQTMTIMQDVFQSPLVKAQLLELLKKVVDDSQNPPAKQESKEESKKDEQSKDQGSK